MYPVLFQAPPSEMKFLWDGNWTTLRNAFDMFLDLLIIPRYIALHTRS